MITLHDVRTMSTQDLALLGLENLAYLRAATVDGTPGFAIFAADGTRLAFAPTRAQAVAAVREHDLEPVSVH